MDVIIFNPSPSSTSHWMPVLMCLCAGAACQGLKDGFHYSVVNPQLGNVTVYWMNGNKLKLNTDKTEVMPVGSASRLESFDSECANIGGNSVPFKTSVKYLGVHLDRTLSVQQHTNNICYASFQELRWIASIWLYLSQSAAARLVVAMVVSHLDYCSLVFTGLPADQITRLQQVQNNAAWLVMKKRWDHVTPLLKELHWLR